MLLEKAAKTRRSYKKFIRLTLMKLTVGSKKLFAFKEYDTRGTQILIAQKKLI